MSIAVLGIDLGKNSCSLAGLDERVRETIRLVFDIFDRRGSVHGVMRYLVEHDIALPDRVRSGPATGEVAWRRPHRGGIINLLTNPAYAGTYAFGRRPPESPASRISRSCTQRPSRDPEDWRVLLHGRWPAYISWETFEENQRRLMANRSKHKGVPRGGPSLLAGLLYCGRCGCRMVTCYRNNGHDLRYSCTRHQINYGAPPCQALSGAKLDALVTRLILEVLRPSAVEVSLQMAEDIELERTARHRQWALRLEQAHYEVERAERQYNAVEPENRLVARTLERHWEEALTAETRLREEHTRFLSREPARLSPGDRDAIRRLSEEVPALWHAETTTAAERKEIARLLLERIEVTLHGDTEQGDYPEFRVRDDVAHVQARARVNRSPK
ncbi:recombinase family protein, partial [Rhodovastum atsumiense]